MRTDKMREENFFQTFLRSRRSIRSFRTDPVPTEILNRILETSTCAPSAHNLQPWRFIVLTSTEAKTRFSEAVTGKFRQDMIADGVPEQVIEARIDQTIRRARLAPIIVVLCRDRKMVKTQPDAVRKEAETRMGVQSVAMAGLQLLLAAHAEGLGGIWICWPLFAPEETIHALELDADWEPQGMVILGYPDEAPEMPARISYRKLSDHYENCRSGRRCWRREAG